MKKYLTGVLAFVLVIALTFSLAGCGKKNDTNQTPVVSQVLPPEYIEDTSGIEGYWIGNAEYTADDGTVTTINIEFIFREDDAIAINQDNEATLFKYLYDGEETFIFQDVEASEFKLDGNNLTIKLGESGATYNLKRKVGSDKNHTALIGNWAGSMLVVAEDDTVQSKAVEFYFVGDKFVQIDAGANNGAVVSYTFDGITLNFDGANLVEHELNGNEFNFVINGTYCFALERV